MTYFLSLCRVLFLKDAALLSQHKTSQVLFTELQQCHNVIPFKLVCFQTLKS